MLCIKNRVHTSELLDADNIPVADLYQNLKELNVINNWLGGHDITLTGLKKLLTTHKHSSVTVADVGCGGGDNLKYIAKWARTHNKSIIFIGIDIKQDCINYAQKNCESYPEISFICADYRSIKDDFDIIFSSLFCHHLNNEQLGEFIAWCSRYSKIGFFVNDLQRNYLAYYSIKWLTWLFSNSYLVKNDAPLSVKRAFLKYDWDIILGKMPSHIYTVQWKWAFRYLVTVTKKA